MKTGAHVTTKVKEFRIGYEAVDEVTRLARVRYDHGYSEVKI